MGVSFKVLRCPLKDAWREAGIEGEAMARLCRIAGAFDRGLFEATEHAFHGSRTWRAGDGEHCCEIHLRNRDCSVMRSDGGAQGNATDRLSATFASKSATADRRANTF